MMRLLILRLVIVCFLSVTSVASAQPPLNVVLIVADDLGWSDLACYGADLHETPHLDRLAKRGVRFTNAYAVSLCSPSRAALLTGKHYAKLGMTTWHEAASEPPPQDKPLIPPRVVANLPLDEVTLADVFQQAGYKTASVGKWHLGGAEYYPETQGFDINIGGTLWGAPQTYFYPYRGLGRFGKEFRYVPHLENGNAGEHLTDRLTDEALRVIDQTGEAPFFLYLAHHAPHTPIEAPVELVAYYEKKIDATQPKNHKNATYAAMVHRLDQSVGRVMEKLDQRGLTNRTLFIFVSDNGGHINTYNNQSITTNAPLRSGKGSLYEGGVRVPLLISGPGVSGAGQVCDEPVYIADLYPTILALAGLKGNELHNEQVDGLSLVPLLQNPDVRLEREAMYFHYPHYYFTTTPVGAIRAREWKLLEYFEDGRLELYNLKDDPSESNNLTSIDPARAQALQATLAAWRNAVHAPMPVNHESRK